MRSLPTTEASGHLQTDQWGEELATTSSNHRYEPDDDFTYPRFTSALPSHFATDHHAVVSQHEYSGEQRPAWPGGDQSDSVDTESDNEARLRTAEQYSSNLTTRSAAGGEEPPSDPTQTLLPRPFDLVSEYEEFDTIDWVRDEEEHHHDRESFDAYAREHPTLLNKLRREFLRSQAWLFVLLVGSSVAVLVSFVDIALEWLVDVRFGYCTTGYFEGQASCCADVAIDQKCTTWVTWAAAFGVIDQTSAALLNWFWYSFFGVLFAFLSVWLVINFAPRAGGSGIPELKALLGGFVIYDFLTVKTLLIKLVGVILSVASGLQLGKEGPLAHIGAATVSLFDWFLPFYGKNEVKRREIISAGTACGVGLAFGTPVGGVLFSLEEASYYFPHKTMWRSFFAAAIAAMVLQAINPLHNGKLVSFSVSYPHGWRWFEMPFYILIAVLGGFAGKLFVGMNMRIAEFRKHTNLRKWPITEVLVLTFITAVCCWPNNYTRGDLAETMAVLFSTCDSQDDRAVQSMVADLCASNPWPAVIALLLGTLVRLILCTMTAGVRVPSGLFIPSMCIGAMMGRAVGMLVQQLWMNNLHAGYFSECQDVDSDLSVNSCVIPGTYALMGAAAVLAGFTRATISLVVIVFELTGNSDFILPVMVSVLVGKTVADWLGGEGIYEEQIILNELPYLDHKRSYHFNHTTAEIMHKNIVAIPYKGNTLRSLRHLLSKHLYSGYPVTDVGDVFIGYMQYKDLKESVDARLPHLNPDTPCVLGPEELEQLRESRAACLDFTDLFDKAPMMVKPTTPLRLVFRMFKDLGFRYLLVVERGVLVGLLTKKDILQYIALYFDKRIRTFLPAVGSASPLSFGAPT